jgi:hypothetical protein
MPIFKNISNPTWNLRITEHFNFTEKVRGWKDHSSGETVSQKTHKDGEVIGVAKGQQDFNIRNWPMELMIK